MCGLCDILLTTSKADKNVNMYIILTVYLHTSWVCLFFSQDYDRFISLKWWNLIKVDKWGQCCWWSEFRDRFWLCLPYPHLPERRKEGRRERERGRGREREEFSKDICLECSKDFWIIRGHDQQTRELWISTMAQGLSSFFKNLFYWGIVDLECYINFC